MSSVSVATLKTYFNTGDKPTEANFIDVFDSMLNLADGGSIAGLAQFDAGIEKGVSLLSGGKTLTSADSGDVCIFNAAAETVCVLPAPNLGMKFDFICVITATGDLVVQAGTDDHGFLGGVTCTQLTSTAPDQCDSFSTATDGNNDFITMNGTTTGGVAGSTLMCAAILATSAAKAWAVTGNLICTGAMATPFADSQI
jgi:hypothetical protein